MIPGTSFLVLSLIRITLSRKYLLVHLLSADVVLNSNSSHLLISMLIFSTSIIAQTLL